MPVAGAKITEHTENLVLKLTKIHSSWEIQNLNSVPVRIMDVRYITSLTLNTYKQLELFELRGQLEDSQARRSSILNLKKFPFTRAAVYYIYINRVELRVCYPCSNPLNNLGIAYVVAWAWQQPGIVAFYCASSLLCYILNQLASLMVT